MHKIDIHQDYIDRVIDRGGMMLNFRTMMVGDGCAAPDDYLHNATLNNFYLQFGDVQGTDEIIALLKAGAGRAAAAE